MAGAVQGSCSQMALMRVHSASVSSISFLGMARVFFTNVEASSRIFTVVKTRQALAFERLNYQEPRIFSGLSPLARNCRKLNASCRFANRTPDASVTSGQ